MRIGSVHSFDNSRLVLPSLRERQLALRLSEFRPQRGVSRCQMGHEKIGLGCNGSASQPGAFQVIAEAVAWAINRSSNTWLHGRSHTVSRLGLCHVVVAPTNIWVSHGGCRASSVILPRTGKRKGEPLGDTHSSIMTVNKGGAAHKEGGYNIVTGGRTGVARSPFSTSKLG